MVALCTQQNCTVGETGTCLLENDPKTCPKRIAALSIDPQIAPQLSEPQQRPRFPLSLTLTPERTRELMGDRYCWIVGILGAPDAGKTAVLVSSYLLISRARLAGFEFADSRSLRALDEISQAARRWNEGNIPDQLTVHTELSDDRTAGFLHLRLRSAGSTEPIDVLLPDLPGEWSTALVDTSRADRLQFLKAADVVWLMVDGVQLSAPATRQLALHRTKLLMQRLAALVAPPPPVILVVTRRDRRSGLDQAIATSLNAEADELGLSIEIAEIASFADDGEVAPGTGIAELIAASISTNVVSTQEFWPTGRGATNDGRAIMRYGVPSERR